ncbi:uncharacterized protein LOC130500651 [Raphanus sativus]|uniref:Uncharacterized protein LOC130500651 n=1 Tax=Raphanus sativus TaxID=3726 RepID=A0A9W3CJV6_RAPSA|nr:uncharacterized protein LOC130500651 [Raphanus sativus]
MEVAELLKKGYLREFLSDKAKNLLNKEAHGLLTEAAPALPPQQDRVIHVITGGSEVNIISSAASKRSTRNASNSQEAEGLKRLLLGTDEISFTAREQEKVLAPHHDALVISLTIANCLVKRILVDNGLEPTSLTRKATPLVDFSREVKQTLGEVLLPVYAEGINKATKFLVVDCPSSYSDTRKALDPRHGSCTFDFASAGQVPNSLGALKRSREIRRMTGPATRLP